MKIGSTLPVVNWVTAVKEKGEDGGGPGAGGGHHSQQQPSDQKKDSEADLPKVEASEEDLQSALQKFQEDPHAQSSGLKAEKEGQGPGLRVILKDVNGQVVRQLSGNEFVQLGDSATPGAVKRGRLLDKKC